MKKTVWTRSFGYSGNLKSKTCPFDVLRAGSEISRRIENPKWLGLWVFALLVVTGAGAEAQQPTKIPRIGYVSGTGDVSNQGPYVEALRQGLRDLGYVEGKNFSDRVSRRRSEIGTDARVVCESSATQGRYLLSRTAGSIRAAKQATRTIPIIMVSSGGSDRGWASRQLGAPR